jgi:DNA-binding transcriptional LysR family regulator
MIRYLKTFLTTARTSSFSAAGAEIGLTQSAVSTQIKRLEDDLHCELFDRSAKSVVLSEAGRALLPAATQIVTLYEQMKKHPGGIDVAGKIQIGAISSAQLGLLPGALQILKTQFPRVEINIVPGMSIQLLAQVDSGEIDMGLMIRPPLRIPKDLQWTPVLREAYAAVAPADTTEKKLRDLMRNHSFIRYNRYSHGGRLVEQFLRKQRIAVNEAMELDEPAVILKMVERGLGVSIIPLLFVLDNIRTTARIVPLGDMVYREIGILQRAGNKENPIAASLRQAIASVADEMVQRADVGVLPKNSTVAM